MVINLTAFFYRDDEKFFAQILKFFDLTGYQPKFYETFYFGRRKIKERLTDKSSSVRGTVEGSFFCCKFDVKHFELFALLNGYFINSEYKLEKVSK